MNKINSKKSVVGKKSSQSASNYPIGDFFIRIKNAALSGSKQVETGYTKFINSAAKLLEREGYLRSVKKEGGKLSAGLVYKHKKPVIMDVRLISRPGLRVYMGVKDLEQRKGPSTLILSTGLGVVTSKEAIKRQIGGEVIVEIF